jgi:hypothetical protein
LEWSPRAAPISFIIKFEPASLQLAQTERRPSSSGAAAALFFEENLMRCELSLICVSAFAGYREGDHVRDPVEIKKLSKHNSRFARVRSIAREPAPQTPIHKDNT